MVLHFLRGWEDEAHIVYETLKDKFPKGNAGHPIFQFATVFFDEFKKSGDASYACKKVIEHVGSEDLDYLSYLGSRDHGSQSLIYVIENICPY